MVGGWVSYTRVVTAKTKGCGRGLGCGSRGLGSRHKGHTGQELSNELDYANIQTEKT